MNILFIHNFHREGSASGDDVVVRNEVRLLKDHGHNVEVFARYNSEVDRSSFFRKFLHLGQIPWSWESYYRLKKFLKEKNFDIAHVHTWFPLLSPSIYFALYEEGIPIVQSLHDFRFFCPVAFFFRNGRICEKCAREGLHNAILNRCYENSYLKSFLATLPLYVVKYRKVFDLISLFIVFTEFGKEKFVELGIPEEKIRVKPHFLPNARGYSNRNREFFLYVGRLSVEKGVDFLLKTWEKIPEKLVIVGSGPLENMVRDYAKKFKNITYAGYVPHEKVYDYMERAIALIVPSVWYETFGMIIMEAFSVGTPVVASKVGALQSMIQDGVNGFLFPVKDGEKLKKYLHNLKKKARWKKISRQAYNAFVERFGESRNYLDLMEIYTSVER